jgi:TRAP-type transport system periplasmic protein
MLRFFRLATALALVTIAGAARADEVNWRYFGFVPATHGFAQQLQRTFDRISERTNGEFTIRYVFYGETPYKAADSLTIIRDGQVEMSDWLAAYSTGTYPILAAPDLPFLRPNVTDAAGAMDAAQTLWGTPKINAVLDGLFSDFNAYVAAKYFYETVNIFFTEPVSSSEDLEGRKVRVYSPELTNLMEAVGATPLLMPIPDVYPALQRGTIDGTFAGISSLRGSKWSEVLTSGYMVRMSIPLAAAIANQDKVDQLSAEHRTALDEEMQAFRDDMLEFVATQEAAETKALEELGITLTEATEEDYARMRQLAMDEVWPEWVSKVGSEEAQPILDELIGAMQDQ